MLLNEPNNGDWYMVSWATSHLHADAGIVTSTHVLCLSSSLLVCNGSMILFSKIGDNSC